MSISTKKLDEYIWNKIWELGAGEPISVITLFHHVKDDHDFYHLMGKNISNIEHRRLLRNYAYTVPKLEVIIKRLQKKGLVSGPRRIER